ncbi:MAG: glutamate racemase [Saccharofermentanales bacterium]
MMSDECYKGDCSSPIGIFDSGLGGLTVQKEVSSQLPDENTVYFGDSGRAPYGTKSKETIIGFARQDTRFLLEMNVKMIVIACNTASANAYKEIAAIVDIPVVEVIRPGAYAAVKATRNGRIGIIGTAATVDSQVYVEAIHEAAKETGRVFFDDGQPIEVFQQACPLFVGLVEEGWWDNDVTMMTAKIYLESLKEKGIDTLVMGCTHYPLLAGIIEEVMGGGVVLINSASEVAKTIGEVLKEKEMENRNTGKKSADRLFFTSDSEEKFKKLGSAILNMTIGDVRKIEIEKY